MFRQINYKRIAVIITILLILITLGTAHSANPGAASPDHITLSWTSDPTTAITITWRTNSQTQDTIVQYAPQKSHFPENAVSVKGSIASYSSSTGSMNIHRAALTNLQPGTIYIYRVGDGSSWSSINKFKTESLHSNQLTVIVFSDSQSGMDSSYNYQPWKQVLSESTTRENPDFAVVDGDLVEVGQSQRQWDAWYDAGQGILEDIPLMPVTGNHETYYEGKNKSGKPIPFTKQFTLPDNGPANLEGQVYSYDYGPVHFAVLDSQGQEEGSQILNAQKAWLDRDLKTTKQTWKIVFFHKSPYSVKTNRPNIDVKTAFCSILEKNHVDLVINGHDHAYARTYPIFNGKIATGLTQGTIYVIAGRSGAKVPSDVAPKSYTAKFYNPKDQPVYSLLKVKANHLQLTTKKTDGTVIDSFSINKNF